MRAMPTTEQLPYALYTAAQVREFDRIVIEDYGIPGADLMERAGTRSYHWIQQRWPDLSELLVVCGTGNNAGDGLVLARHARQGGLRVRVLQLGDGAKLRGDALAKADAWRALGGEIEPYAGLPGRPGLIVDAMLGTGLERDVTGPWADAIDEINRHQAPVFALDIPSGLNADSGRVMGSAIHAEATLSFIGLKQGMFTGEGPDCCGEVGFDALDVPARTYGRQRLAVRRIDWHKQSDLMGLRRRTAHKGDFGHLLVIGGGEGYAGAARLAAEAGVRSGAGLVTVASHPEHAALLNVGRPELMCRGVETGEHLAPLIERASVIALGPGLGRDDWGERMFLAASASALPTVLDADGLFWLSRHQDRRDNRIITPHPGEAACLLGCSTAEVQADRFAAVRGLQERFGGVVVLKGAGTLIVDGSAHPPALCSDGNPGMAGGGTGDLLTGVVGAMLAQGQPLRQAAELGVSLHAAAGDLAATKGEIGMLAGDLLPELRSLLNRGAADA
jgi:NAD(P)H-hydrate epimerase